MLTLSILKTDFKKILKYIGILLVILIILFILFRVSIAIKNALFPPPPPAPTASFGVLPPISFPESIKKDFTYEIDTLPGDLPKLPNLTEVYMMEKRGPDILAVNNASNRVEQLGYNYSPQQISDFIYRWTHPNPPNQVLILDIRLNEFNITSSFLNYEQDLKERNFSSELEIISSANIYLSSLDLYPADIDPEKTKVDFSYLNQGGISQVNKVNNSNIATVHFFQKDKNEIPIVYPQAKNSSMRLTVGAGRFYGEILEASFSHQNILEESSTYPIKTAEEAFEELKNGNAFIASHSGDNTNVKIKEVYLALYSEGKLQKHLTPVIVFEGDNNFVAYVPAITDEWIDK
jgi:hypothetical protein